MKAKFTGQRRSYKKVPIEIRDLWFSEFKHNFRWREEHGHKIRMIFDHVASNALKNRLYDAKTTNRRLPWISDAVWAPLLKEWGMKTYKTKCAKNKQNYASNCGGEGFSSHVGGSITHSDKLREKLGRESLVAENFMQTHSCLNSEGERVWSNERYQTRHDAYVERYEQLSSEGETSAPLPPLQVQMESKELGHHPTIADSFMRLHSKMNKNGERVWVNDLAKKSHDTHTHKMDDISSQNWNTEEEEIGHSTPTELQVWTEVVDGPKKGLLRGLGSHGSYRSGSSFSNLRYDSQTWQTERKELLNEITNLRQNYTMQQENISKRQDEIEFLKSQFAIFQQQIGGFLATPSRPPVSSLQYTSHD